MKFDKAIDDKTQWKFLIALFPFAILFFIAVIVFSSVYSKGNIHMFPNAFAVDHQERLYLMFKSGVYVKTDDALVGILPSYDRASAILISESNQLSYVRGGEITTYDIDQSQPVFGKMVEVGRYFSDDETLFDSANRFVMKDEQNGVTYTYRQRLFNYFITREQDNETTMFYQMPHKDFIWNLIVDGFILIGILLHLTLIGGYLCAYQKAARVSVAAKLAQGRFNEQTGKRGE